MGISVALLVLERGTGLRRFSSLPVSVRQRRLERLAASRGLRRVLSFLLKALASFGYGRDPAVLDRLGMQGECQTAGSFSPPPPLATAAPSGSDEECDVVV